MDGSGFVHLVVSHFHRQLRLAHSRTVGLCLADPSIDVFFGGLNQNSAFRKAFGFGIAQTHHHIQRQAFGAQLVFSGNGLGISQVKAGLCIAHAGDGGRAHFKVALGRRQLFADGFLLVLYQLQVVFAGEHIKVSLRHANQQIMLSGFILRSGLLQLAATLSVSGPCRRAVNGLHQRGSCGFSF